MPTPVLLVTCAAWPDGDADELGLLADACARAGLDARWVAWDDPAVDWSAAALSVLRSTWDYTSRREEFLAWSAGVPRLFNPSSVIGWNSDKSYLRELAAAGIPVVPTNWAAPSEAVLLDGPGEIVVKPSVGAGSMGAGRFPLDRPGGRAAARAHAEHLQAAGRTVMVQPYLDGVDRSGEAALIFVAGRFSHAVTKSAMLPEPVAHRLDGARPRDLFVGERITARDPSPAELDTARRVLAAVGGADDLLYARVDLLPGPDGPVLVELELVEPSLYLQYSDGAPDRLAAAIADRASADRAGGDRASADRAGADRAGGAGAAGSPP